MGKNLISQRRGKGSLVFKAKSFKYAGKIEHVNYTKEESKGIIKDLIHSAGHSAPLALLEFEDKEQVLLPAPEGVRVGETVEMGKDVEVKPGNMMKLKNIPEGTFIFNIEGFPGDGGKFVRSSGTFARLLTKTDKEVTVELPSKAQKTFKANCRAVIGVIAGGGRVEKPLMKAGNRHYKMRARNKRYPEVSGVAMNAVAHPHGGSSSGHKGKPTIARKYAPAGAKVGSIKPRRTGRRKGKK